MTPFETLLVRQIRKAIRDWKAEGTTGASVECLMQCVRPPSHTESGAPNGTNAQYYYAQTTHDVLLSAVQSALVALNNPESANWRQTAIADIEAALAANSK